MNPKLTIAHMLKLRKLLTALEDGPLWLEDLKQALLTAGEKPGQKVETWLKSLEKELGAPKGGLLLETESTGPSSLSPAGRRICQTFARVLDEIEGAVDPEIADRRLRVKIGLINALTSNLLPRVLTGVGFFEEARFSSVDVKIVEGENHELERHVQTGWADFAIAPGDPRRKTTLCKIEGLCHLNRVLIFNPQLQKTWKDDLLKWATDGCGIAAKERFQRCLAEQTVLIPPRSVMPEVDDLMLPPKAGRGRHIKIPQASQRRSWVRQGLGVAFAHQDIFAEEAVAGNLISEIDLSDLIGSTELCLYLPKSAKRLSEPALAIIEFIKRTYQTISGDDSARPNFIEDTTQPNVQTSSQDNIVQEGLSDGPAGNR